jgi:hypothetical protein
MATISLEMLPYFSKSTLSKLKSKYWIKKEGHQDPEQAQRF